jgi:hypothetical protein
LRSATGAGKAHDHENIFIEKTFRTHSTNSLRQQKSIRDHAFTC